ncbi:unnamed protein product [Schistosoma mattheei]|uniref:Uncharacterized protein n=1 Tax=Schistosoma mattheei TaxID=31246 RepID=A0A183PX06_9TREM|nr:unnamed protein product [Schistosoma mattheei]
MHSAKYVSEWPQSTDVFVRSASQLSKHVFERHDSLRRPLETEYEGSFKVINRQPKYHIIDKNGTDDNASTKRPEADY